MDALVVDQLAEVDDRRARLARRTPRSRSALPSSGSRSFALPGFGGSRRASSSRPRERLRARQRSELVDVDARRHLVDAVDVTDDVLEHLADVLRADEHRLRPRERLAPPRRQLLVAAHRVLELGAVRLDRVARAGRGADGPAEQDVVREDDVGRQALAQRRGVQLDVALALARASGPAAAAPRAPRSGRARRPAAARRCSGRTSSAPPRS